MITLTQVAAVLIRLFAIWWFVDAVLVILTLPNEFLGLLSFPSGFGGSQREMALAMQLIRLLIYLGLGTTFLLFTRPLAKLLAKGLEREI